MAAHHHLGPQFWHGTTLEGAWSIDKEGIKAAGQRSGHDTLPTVYATTTEEGAQYWARRRAKENPGMGGAVVGFHADPEKITNAAREGEVMHWGDVPASQIHTIYEMEEEDD